MKIPTMVSEGSRIWLMGPLLSCTAHHRYSVHPSFPLILRVFLSKKNITRTHPGSHRRRLIAPAPSYIQSPLFFARVSILFPAPAAPHNVSLNNHHYQAPKPDPAADTVYKEPWRILQQRSISTRSSTGSWKVSWHATFFPSFTLGHATLWTMVGGSAGAVDGV